MNCEGCNNCNDAYLVKIYLEIGNEADNNREVIKNKLLELAGVEEVQDENDKLIVLYDDRLINIKQIKEKYNNYINSKRQ